MNREITITIKAFPGEKVMVKNYRSKYPEWEPGEVLNCESTVYEDGRTRMSYRVILERKSTKGNYLFLHVGDDSISFPNIGQITKLS